VWMIFRGFLFTGLGARVVWLPDQARYDNMTVIPERRDFFRQGFAFISIEGHAARSDGGGVSTPE